MATGVVRRSSSPVFDAVTTVFSWSRTVSERDTDTRSPDLTRSVRAIGMNAAEVALIS
jgi:hypothetical protein